MCLHPFVIMEHALFLPNSFGITQSQLVGHAPLGILAEAQAFHLIVRPEVLQYTTNHVHADIRALLLNLGNPQRAVSSADSLKNKAGFLSFRTLQLTDALLKLPVGGLDDEKEIVDVGPRIVLSLVPAVRALLKGFAITLLVLFDETFQADESANVVSQQEVEAGTDSNLRKKSRKVIMAFPFRKETAPPAPSSASSWHPLQANSGPLWSPRARGNGPGL